jgi:hypothetical protein
VGAATTTTGTGPSGVAVGTILTGSTVSMMIASQLVTGAGQQLGTVSMTSSATAKRAPTPAGSASGDTQTAFDQ